MTLKAVLFDLDGTLLDTAPDFVTVLNKLLLEEKKPALDYTLIRNTVSNGARALVQLGFQLPDNHSDFERLRQRLLTLYSQHLADDTRAFPGIEDTLRFVAENNMAWGVVTNKPALYTEPLMNKMIFPILPGAIVCPDHVTQRKPHPEALLLACSHLNISPQEAIYVGDHRRDIEAGRNAGMPTIACAYGYIENGDDINDWHADYIVQHSRDIIPIISAHL